ncbi:MAG: TatD family hydrolase [Candidatus Thorarchaeota archaeon]|nr:TatD family hydrolase [Candidatus Thorarchaeota archaeon]
MKLFDAHTHIDMKNFQNDREKVISRAKSKGLVGMVTSSIGPGSFRRTLGIVDKHRGYIYHSAGCGVSQLTRNDADTIISLTRKYASNIVSVGEVGLDYHWIKDAAGRKAQEPLFSDFISLASELNLPLVIHSRKAEAEAAEILEREFGGEVLMHCFDGPPAVAQQIEENGWHITLPANFTRSRNRVEAARILPLENILLETDGPYLSPTEKRNEPANIEIGCKMLADTLDLPFEDVAKQTTENALRFYNL